MNIVHNLYVIAFLIRKNRKFLKSQHTMCEICTLYAGIFLDNVEEQRCPVKTHQMRSDTQMSLASIQRFRCR